MTAMKEEGSTAFVGASERLVILSGRVQAQWLRGCQSSQVNLPLEGCARWGSDYHRVLLWR